MTKINFRVNKWRYLDALKGGAITPISMEEGVSPTAVSNSLRRFHVLLMKHTGIPKNDPKHAYKFPVIKNYANELILLADGFHYHNYCSENK